MKMTIERYNEYFAPAEETKHYKKDRKGRSNLAAELIEKEHGEVADVFLTYCEKNGANIAVIYTNAVIRLYNPFTKRHITDLIARPGQIKRYYTAVFEKPPISIMDYAFRHQEKGYNV